MSAAVKMVKKVVSAVLDPFSDDEPETVEETTGLSEAEASTLAAEEAERKTKAKSSGTKTVLTSPLGSTTSAKSAVTKLGGS
ncbi:hypothetical protein NVP1182O_03 [Vibrio phage 1.182.O._10N.286.46.E1]|nr:hypothetical protein NVP1182O_03 [Vibrio phage 1.182.O._10N.286.46.E1]